MSDCLSSDPAPIFTAGQLLNLFEAQFPPGTKRFPPREGRWGSEAMESTQHLSTSRALSTQGTLAIKHQTGFKVFLN